MNKRINKEMMICIPLKKPPQDGGSHYNTIEYGKNKEKRCNSLSAYLIIHLFFRIGKGENHDVCVK